MNIWYEDFWGVFKEDVENKDHEWYFSEFLPSIFDVNVTPNNPEVLAYSVFGHNYNNGKYSDCKKVFYSIENMNKNIPRIKHADYTITHHVPGEGHIGEHIDEDTHLRISNFYRRWGPDRIKSELKSFDVEKEFEKKDKFCCLVTRHENAVKREEILKKIHNNYKSVDCAGKGYNNMEDGWTVPGSWLRLPEFAQNYKFMITAENRSVPGYTSEKLFTALRSRTVPIYWGDPYANELFNSEAFVNVSDFENYDELIEYIEYLDNNDETYKEILSADPLPCPIEEHEIFSPKKVERKTREIFG